MKGFALLGPILCLLASGTPSSASPEDSPTQPKVNDIRASLFYERSGRLSEDLTRQPLTLWNVPIASGGDVEEPASHVVVVVILRGPADWYEGETRLRFVATADGVEKPLLDETRILGVFGPDGTWSAPFLLTDVTCYQLELEATVVGSSETYSEAIEFRCGE